MEQLAVLNALPDDLDNADFVLNRALDVRSAAMLYLALVIRNEATSFGIPGMNLCSLTLNSPGRIVKVFFNGDSITDSEVYLETCVKNYTQALNNIVGIRLIIQVREIVKGIGRTFVQSS